MKTKERKKKEKDVSRIEEGIPGKKKNERRRVVRRALRLVDSITIAVVCFLLTTYACTTHTHPSSNRRMRRICFYP
jgi:hypothetical protein